MIVPGSSIAPRSRGSSDLDAAAAERAVATRRLAGPATAAGAAPTPGHGLLLRSVMSWVEAPPPARSRSSAGSGVLSARPRAPLAIAWSRQSSVAADVRAAAGQPPGRVDDDAAVRRPDDPQQLALRTHGPAGDARSRSGARRGRARRRRAATTPPPRWRRRPSSAARFGLAAGAARRRLGGVAAVGRRRRRRRRPRRRPSW